MTQPVVVVDRAGVKRLGTGHPWIFGAHVVSAADAHGRLVRVEGPVGRFRAWAVLGAASRIPLRVVSRREEFTGDVADESWWHDRLAAAVDWRGEDVVAGDEAFRLVHAEADGLPGLVVDRYGDIAVLQAGCAWADRVAPDVAARLMEQHGLRGVLARHDGGFRRPEGLAEGVSVLAGEVPEDVTVKLGGLARRVDPWRGQKTGTFLDQRCNQRWAATELRAAPGARMLDAFCHTGGFALVLAAAGADVDAVDSSRPALERMAADAEVAGLTSRVTGVRANVFEHLRAAASNGETFDGIVLDPPALAKRKAELASALRGYKELNLRALSLLKPGGRLVTCSCSAWLDRRQFVDMLGSAAADARVDAVVREVRGAAPCHPWRPEVPESAYLDVALVEVRGVW